LTSQWQAKQRPRPGGNEDGTHVAEERKKQKEKEKGKTGGLSFD